MGKKELAPTDVSNAIEDALITLLGPGGYEWTGSGPGEDLWCFKIGGEAFAVQMYVAEDSDEEE